MNDLKCFIVGPCADVRPPPLSLHADFVIRDAALSGPNAARDPRSCSSKAPRAAAPSPHRRHEARRFSVSPPREPSVSPPVSRASPPRGDRAGRSSTAEVDSEIWRRQGLSVDTAPWATR
ncbi:unnamed protein product [Knipowitschia caucasica]